MAEKGRKNQQGRVKRDGDNKGRKGGETRDKSKEAGTGTDMERDLGYDIGPGMSDDDMR